MSDTQGPTATRPPQVTVAGWVTILGSVFLVTGMFEAIGGLRSIESRESIAESLSRPPLDGLGLDVSGALEVLHGIFVVAGALGAAACVLGWFVLQRHKQARLALSVVAVPLFFSGFFSGSLAATFVAVSAMLLWSGPARDWFAGRPVRRPPMLFAPPSGPSGPSTAPPPDAAARVGAPSLPPTGPGVASDAPPPYAGYGAPRVTSPYGPVDARPPALLAAVVITWIAAATVVLVFGVLLVVALGEPALFERIMAQDERVAEMGVSTAELRSGVVAFSAIAIGWAVAAATLALLVLLRVAWARPLLIASAVASGLTSFLMVAAIIPVVTAVAGMVSAYLLLRPEVARWVSRR